MVDKIGNGRATNTTIDRVDDPRLGLEEVARKPSYEEATVSLASSFVATALRPPALQFYDQLRLDKPRFESQAIKSIEALKERSTHEVVDELSKTLQLAGPDIMQHGSDSAKKGLAKLDQFTNNSAFFNVLRQTK